MAARKKVSGFAASVTPLVTDRDIREMFAAKCRDSSVTVKEAEASGIVALPDARYPRLGIAYTGIDGHPVTLGLTARRTSTSGTSVTPRARDSAAHRQEEI